MIRRAWASVVQENADSQEGARFDGQHLTALLVSLAAAVYFLWASYDFGIRHEFHEVMPDAIESHNVSVATAITELAHDVSAGYVAHGEVLAALRRNGMSFFPDFLGPIGKFHPDVLREPETMNAALRAARDAGSLGPMSLADGTMAPMVAEDLGQADFYKLALVLFGYDVRGFFDAYFVLLALSMAAFAAAFARWPSALLVLVAFGVGHCFAMTYIATFGWSPQESSPNAMIQLATVHNRRFMSALGILPVLHIALALWLRVKLKPLSAVSLSIQVLLLMFVMTVRASIVYGLIFVVALCLAMVWKRWRRREGGRSGFGAFRALWFWPVPIIVAGYAVLSIYRAVAIHPLYSTMDEYIPHHLVWHSAYYGLTYHPDWQERFAATHDFASGDQVPFKGAALYLAKAVGLGEGYTTVGPGKGIRWRTHERVVRRAYADFVTENPGFAAGLHVWHKPRALVENFFDSVAKARHVVSGLGVVVGAVLCFLAAASVGVVRGGGPWDPILLTVGGGCASLLPVVFAYPVHHGVGDQMIWLMMALVLAALGSIGTILRVVRHR